MTLGTIVSVKDDLYLIVRRLGEGESLGVPARDGAADGPGDVVMTGEAWSGAPVGGVARVQADRPRVLTTRDSVERGRVTPSFLDRVLRRFAGQAAVAHWEARPPKVGNYLPPSGKVLDQEELFGMIDASLDGWLTTGHYNDAFEKALATFVGTRYALSVNSGSSANLLALSALTSPTLGDRALAPGDEVVTVAAGFPTTVAPIVQNGLVPVFVDVELGTYNIDVTQVEAALSPKTKAIFVAHTLGNPFRVDEVMRLADKRGLWVIEDNCDALGAKVAGKRTGTFGHLATCSFYPAHHITMGEGGAVLTSEPRLNKLVMSFRDWGRDCWCPPGKDNTCGKHFTQAHGRLPSGYDHKYVYSHLGYNLKITDWQAAIGLAQLAKLPGFIEKRRENFRRLSESLAPWSTKLLLPRATDNSEPSWFGFPISVRGGVDKNALAQHLESQGVGTRNLFAGNMLRQPAFVSRDVPLRIRDSSLLSSRTLDESHLARLPNTDAVMRDTFWIGVWPGLGPAEVDRMAAAFRVFFGG
jgi:CDP-6-deoxy-D-xylo-4-hexulose-3-dehydrase